MRTTLWLARNSVRHQRRRLVSVVVTVAIAVAFVAAALLVGMTFHDSTRNQAVASVGDASVVVSSDASGGIPRTLLEQIEATLPGVEARARLSGQVMQQMSGRKVPLVAMSVPRLSDRTTLVEGRLPAARGEVALGHDVAKTRELGVGDTVALVDPRGSGHVSARVVGIVRPGFDVVTAPGIPLVFAADEDIWAWTGTAGYDEVMVHGGGEQSAVRDAVAALPAAQGFQVRTGAQEQVERVAQLTSGATALTSFALIFAGVATFVATLVVSTTLATLVAQRTRQLALLRLVGADRGTVRRSVLLEGALVGVTGSGAGVVLGVALALGVVQLSHGTLFDLGPLSMPVWAFVVPLLVGILTTVLASLVPARNATRVRPVAALGQAWFDEISRRGRRVRLGLGLALALAGGALLLLGATQRSLVFGLPGGAVSFLGVLVLGPAVVAGVLGVVGSPLRRCGTAAELALANVRRNPSRTASTAGALLVGVTLVTMMLVGAATASRTSQAGIDQKTPVDALVEVPPGSVDQGLELVRDSVPVAVATIVSSGSAELVSGAGVELVDVLGVEPDIRQVSHLPEAFEGLADDTLLVPRRSAIRTGQEVILQLEGRSVRLRAVANDQRLKAVVVSRATLAKVVPDAAQGVWAMFHEDQDPFEAAEQLGSDVGTIEGAQVNSLASFRAELNRMIDIALLVVGVLLALSVLIALVGVGNTLALSVFERTRETAMLRTLGLGRGEVRAMYAWEALLIALAAVVLGLVLGTGYGVAGMYAMSPLRAEVYVDIPWLRLLAVAGVALAAGALASVVPAGRAARVRPAVALASQ